MHNCIKKLLRICFIKYNNNLFVLIETSHFKSSQQVEIY